MPANNKYLCPSKYPSMLKYTFAFLWFSVFLLGCNGQTETKPIAAAKPLTAEEKIYYDDATRLALRDLLKTDPPSVNIPEKETEKYLQALMAIHRYIIKKGSSLNEAAEIHTSESPEMYKFAIIVDSSARWIKHWVTYRDKTGDKMIDSLLAASNVEIETYSETPDRSIVFFKTTRPENIAALQKKFSAIKNSTPYSLSQKEVLHDITVHTEGDKRIFVFQSVPHNKSWKFVVDKDFNVTF